jgi:uncharacterized protein YcfJ
MKITALCTSALVAGAAAAGDFIDTAPVVSATPIIERVPAPVQQCDDPPAAAQKERNVLAPIIGGVAGALLGRQVGHGSGRDVATAAGAAVGTMAGDAVANPDANRSYTGAAVGAAAGGILGNQVGHGRGNAAATAAGAIAGTMVGDRVGSRQSAARQAGQRCRMVESTREIVRGYDVVYRYNGRDIATTLPYDPGNSVKVTVGVIAERVGDSGRDYGRDYGRDNRDYGREGRDYGRDPVSSADAPRGRGYDYRY